MRRQLPRLPNQWYALGLQFDSTASDNMHDPGDRGPSASDAMQHPGQDKQNRGQDKQSQGQDKNGLDKEEQGGTDQADFGAGRMTVAPTFPLTQSLSC